AAIHAPLNSRRRASCSSGGSEPQRPCSVGLMTALGWMSSIVFVAIGPAYTVDAYSGGLRGHCTFIYSEKNNTQKQKLEARHKKRAYSSRGEVGRTGAASVYLVGIPLFSEKQLAMGGELLFPSVSGD